MANKKFQFFFLRVIRLFFLSLSVPRFQFVWLVRLKLHKQIFSVGFFLN